MKEIVSKNVPQKWLKRKKNDEAKLTTYWSNLYPSDYAENMTKDYQKEAIQKIDIGLRKIASDGVDVVFSGKLKQTGDGFVFVDIPNSIYSSFLPLLDSGIEKPPENKKHENIGAHISVIKKKEIEENEIKFKDEGKDISYKITGVQKVDDPDGWDEMAAVWFISVLSPDLEKIRKSYGLSPTIKDHDFHITLGVKKRSTEDSIDA